MRFRPVFRLMLVAYWSLIEWLIGNVNYPSTGTTFDSLRLEIGFCEISYFEASNADFWTRALTKNIHPEWSRDRNGPKPRLWSPLDPYAVPSPAGEIGTRFSGHLDFRSFQWSEHIFWTSIFVPRGTFPNSEWKFVMYCDDFDQNPSGGTAFHSFASSDRIFGNYYFSSSNDDFWTSAPT